MPQLKVKDRVKHYLFLFFMTLTVAGYALPSDKEQVMHVVSDSADLSQQNHKGTYTGHVEFIQGTTNLHAASAMTQGNIKNQLTLAIANGSKENPAHYWTETGPNKPPFHAYADTIRYYPLRHLIELIGNAHIEQGANSLSAAKISYDTLEQHIVSQSDGKTRTTIILYPEKKST
jgi:lipopolysaccharide export system protein LptA